MALVSVSKLAGNTMSLSVMDSLSDKIDFLLGAAVIAKAAIDKMMNDLKRLCFIFECIFYQVIQKLIAHCSPNEGLVLPAGLSLNIAGETSIDKSGEISKCDNEAST